MKFTQNVHEQFAQFFKEKELEPYLYLLSKKLSEGHTCIRISDWVGKEVDDLYKIEKPLHKHRLLSQGEEKQPLILHNGYLYFQRYYHYETLVLNQISKLLSKKKQIKDVGSLMGTIRKLFNQQSSSVDWQLVAVLMALQQQFTIITGGPGTGKTTTVAKLLTVLFLEDPSLRVALAAPTGKAASRMAESLKATASAEYFDRSLTKNFESLEPSTIHRLLGTIDDSIYFKHHRERPLNYDVLIIDESSMIDLALFAKLMDAIPEHAQVIFLGDKDQLASVEAGSLFGELCTAQTQLNRFSQETVNLLGQFMPEAKQELEQNRSTSEHPLFEHVIELQKSHRFSATEGIGKLSRAIINSHEEDVAAFFNNRDPRVVFDLERSEKIFSDFVSGYEEFTQEPDLSRALGKLNQLRILCATREGDQGIYKTNSRVEELLQSKNLIKVTGEFYENRPVMVTKNHYNLGLFNGDIGIVRKNSEGELRVYFEENGQMKEVPPAFLTAAETVFAMTIHKSQGSEFNQVLVLLPDTEDMELLTRELLYTGVTRAREKVIIQAPSTVVTTAIQKQVRRGSGIQERFKNTNART